MNQPVGIKIVNMSAHNDGREGEGKTLSMMQIGRFAEKI